MRVHLELRYVATVTGSPHSASLHAGYKAAWLTTNGKQTAVVFAAPAVNAQSLKQ